MLTNYLTRKLTDTAVHWANPVEDGYGGETFDTAVEVDCRWVDVSSLQITAGGEQEGAAHEVYVQATVEEGDWLYHGVLSGLTAAQKANPRKVDGAWMVKKVELIPDFKNGEVRKVYL